jgi:hypothetical protein
MAQPAPEPIRRRSIPVVGAEFFAKNLRDALGASGEQGHEVHRHGVLIFEDENAYDRYAVRVELDGRPIGYLPRPNAIALRDLAQRQTPPGTNMARAIRALLHIRALDGKLDGASSDMMGIQVELD